MVDNISRVNKEALLYISSSSVSTYDVLEAVSALYPITKQIELSGGCRYAPGLLERLIAFKQAHPVQFLLHSYFPPPPDNFVLNFADTGQATRDFIERSMVFVTSLDVPYYSIHAGFRADFSSDSGGLLHQQSPKFFTLDGIAENVRWFKSRWPEILLALENLYPNNGNTSCGFMMSPDEIGEALELMPDIGLLLDLGHIKVSAHLMGFDYLAAVDRIFDQYGSRIMEIHLSENDGTVDDHYPITDVSDQYRIVKNRADFIRDHDIKVTIEARETGGAELEASYHLMLGALVS